MQGLKGCRMVPQKKPLESTGGQECYHCDTKQGMVWLSGQEGSEALPGGSRSPASLMAEAASQAQLAGDTRPSWCHPQGSSCYGARVICGCEMSPPLGGDKCAGKNASPGRSNSQ